MSDSRTAINVIGLASICVCCIGYNFVRQGTAATVTDVVTDKTVKRAGDSDQYLIFTPNETFTNRDELFRGKFDSSDFYGGIKVGKTYEFKVVGWRVPFLSMYRNIVEFKEVK